MEYSNTVCLEEISSKIGDGLHGTPEYDLEGDYYFINGNNLQKGRIIIKDITKKVNKDTYIKNKKELNDNTIMVSINGTIGRIAKYNNENIMLGKSACYINIDKNINKNYIYFLLCSNKFQNYINQYATGTTIKNVSLKTIREFKFYLPKKEKQDQVANVLLNIEEKIFNNEQIIANLEEFSQTIFKRWFVDFEFPDENGNPYKSSGGEMVDSELGEIPSGWKIIELKEVTEIIMGQSPKSDTYNTQNEGLPLLNGATDFKNRNIKPTKYTTDPKKIGQFGDFVFGVRATVGLVTELDRDYAIGRGAGIARINSTHKEWLYEILVKAFQYFENSISGSVYINVSSNDLKKSKVIYPSKKILDAYHKNLVNNFELVKSMKMQIKHLTQLRDTLLPKLMAGEIEIPDDIEVNKDELSI